MRDMVELRMTVTSKWWSKFLGKGGEFTCKYSLMYNRDSWTSCSGSRIKTGLRAQVDILSKQAASQAVDGWHSLMKETEDETGRRSTRERTRDGAPRSSRGEGRKYVCHRPKSSGLGKVGAGGPQERFSQASGPQCRMA